MKTAARFGPPFTSFIWNSGFTLSTLYGSGFPEMNRPEERQPGFQNYFA
jgi:hypothetical protein